MGRLGHSAVHSLPGRQRGCRPARLRHRRVPRRMPSLGTPSQLVAPRQVQPQTAAAVPWRQLPTGLALVVRQESLRLSLHRFAHWRPARSALPPARPRLAGCLAAGAWATAWIGVCEAAVSTVPSDVKDVLARKRGPINRTRSTAKLAAMALRMAGLPPCQKRPQPRRRSCQKPLPSSAACRRAGAAGILGAATATLRRPRRLPELLRRQAQTSGAVTARAVRAAGAPSPAATRGARPRRRPRPRPVRSSVVLLQSLLRRCKQRAVR